MVKAVLFFIAHSGVSQYMQWLHWHMGNPDVALRIFCPPEFPMYGSFERLPFYFQTSWGSPQLVYVQQQGYRHILSEFPELNMIFMVSGTDIPILPIETLIEISEKKMSYIPFVKNDDTGENYILKKIKCDCLKNIPKYQTIQWCHLNATHARYICEFAMWKLQYAHSKIQEEYNKLGERPPVPDEYWPITILTQMPLVDYVDKTLTGQDREHKFSPSPIEWSSFEEEKIVFVCIEKGKDIYEKTTLAKTIAESQADGQLFYRKVRLK